MTVKLREDSITKAHEMLPEHMVQSVLDYFQEGLHPGGFLGAVLANDLVGAFSHADDINKHRIGDFVNWLYWEAPGRPFGWGSYEAIDKWVAEAQEERNLRSCAIEEIEDAGIGDQ